MDNNKLVEWKAKLQYKILSQTGQPVVKVGTFEL